MPLQQFMAITQPELDALVVFALDKLLQMVTSSKCTPQRGAGITGNPFSPRFLLSPPAFLFHFYTISMFPNPSYLKTTRRLKREQNNGPVLRHDPHTDTSPASFQSPNSPKIQHNPPVQVDTFQGIAHQFPPGSPQRLWRGMTLWRELSVRAGAGLSEAINPGMCGKRAN